MKKIFALLCLTTAMFVSAAQAQDSYTGTNSTGVWFANRWNNTSDAAPYTSAFTVGNNAIFTSGNYTFTGMGSASNVGNITLLDNVNVTFTSTGSTLATGGNVRTITVGSGSVLDLNVQAISTAAGTGFIKNGAGVYATGGGAFTNGFTLNAGTVIVRGTTGLGSGTGNVLTLNGGTVAGNATRTLDSTRFGGGIVIGGNVQFGELSTIVTLASSTANLSFANNVSLGAANRTFTLGNQGTQTFSGIISSSGSSGLTFAANAGTTGGLFALTGTASTFTGNIAIDGGEARFSADGSLGNAANDIVIDGGIFSMATGTTNTINAARDIFVGNGAGTGINAMGAAGRIIYNGVIADKAGETGSFTHGGFGTLELGGANTYSGTTTITSGVVVVTNGGRLGATTSSVAISGGVLDLGTQTRTNLALNMSGGTITNGTLEAATLSVSSGSVGAALSGSGSLQKTGAGTVNLSGANTYSGTTAVTAGSLFVNGNQSSANGVLTVASGATLGGSGAIGGAVNVAGTLAPGNSIESLSMGALSFSNGSTFAVELNSSVATSVGADLAVASGGLSLDGTVTLTLNDIALTPAVFSVGTKFSLINYSGSWNNGLFTFGAGTLADGDVFAFGGNTWEIDYNATVGGANFVGDQISGNFVNIEAVPEPSTYALLTLAAIGLAGHLIRRRRR